LVGAGIMSIAMGIFCLVVRSQLVKYKRSAPAKLTALYVWNIVFSVVYTIVGAFGIDMMGMTSTLLPTLFWNVILIIANKVYFKKRAELFCN
jgi:cell shape-determining protein MreD